MRNSLFLLPAVFLLAAGCGSGSPPARPGHDSAGPKDSTADTVAVITAAPLFFPGVEMSVSNGDTSFVIDNLAAYDTFLLKEVVCPLEFDGIPDWTGQDSFPPDWPKRTVAQKVEFLEAYPGSFNQMCADDSWEAKAPTFAYPSGIRWTYSMTPDRFRELREMRDEVIAYLLRERKGKRLTDQDMVIIADLNAVEFIPRLLAAERVLRPMVLANLNKKLKTKKSEADGGWRLVNDVTNTHRQIVETLTHLLRQENYAPLLGSDMEKKYAAELRKESKRDYPVFESYDNLEEKERSNTYMDPVYHLPVHKWFSAEVPFKRTNVELIVNAAARYWRETSPEERKKAGERMTLAPVER